MTDDSQGSSPGTEPDSDDGATRARYDWSSAVPSTAVVETVAVAVDQEPTSLEPLHECVDSDALDALVRSRNSPADADTTTVSFVYADRQVTVRGSGEVIVSTGALEG